MELTFKGEKCLFLPFTPLFYLTCFLNAAVEFVSYAKERDLTEPQTHRPPLGLRHRLPLGAWTVMQITNLTVFINNMLKRNNNQQFLIQTEPATFNSKVRLVYTVIKTLKALILHSDSSFTQGFLKKNSKNSKTFGSILTY